MRVGPVNGSAIALVCRLRLTGWQRKLGWYCAGKARGFRLLSPLVWEGDSPGSVPQSCGLTHFNTSFRHRHMVPPAASPLPSLGLSPVNTAAHMLSGNRNCQTCGHSSASVSSQSGWMWQPPPFMPSSWDPVLFLGLTMQE